MIMLEKCRMKKWFTLAMTMIALVYLIGCGGPKSDPTVAPPESIPVVSSSDPVDQPVNIINEPGAHIRFTHIGIESELSQISINCILQDRQGFMWFGTQDGLNRYDGYNFEIYRPDMTDDSSISGRWITTIFEDSGGKIWVGTRLDGLNRYDPVTNRFTRYMHSAEKEDSISHNRVTAIYEDSNGHLWVGTETGLDQYIPALDGFEHYSLNGSIVADQNSDVSVIFEDLNGSLWVGSSTTGLYRQEPDSFSFTHYTHDPGDATTLSSNNIRVIQQGIGNSLWIASEEGINLFDTITGIATHYYHSSKDPFSVSSNYIQTLYVDRSGILWVGTDAGLDRYQSSSGHFFHYQHDPMIQTSLSNNVVSAIFESRDNVLWVGTFGGGLNKYYRGQDRFSYYFNRPGDPAGLSGNMIFKIHVDEDDKAWLSVLGGGVDCLDMNTGAATHFQHDPGDPGSLSYDFVWAVYTDSLGTLWVGTTISLDRLDPGSDDFIHYWHDPEDPHSLIGTPVYDIIEDENGNLWIGTESGLDYFDRTTGTFAHFTHDPRNLSSISGNKVVNLFIDGNGDLWVGTSFAGLDKFDARSRSFIHFEYNQQDPGSISSDSVLAVFEDSRDILWVGTAGGGLNRYDPETNSFIHFFESDGLPNAVIYGILEDEMGFLWLSTNMGLSRFDPIEVSFRNFTANEGLQGNEFNMNAFDRDADGNLYFGGVNGLTVFQPALISDDTFIPPIALVSITRNGIPLRVKNSETGSPEVELRWPNNNFEFEFTALSYAAPERNLYAYQLENFDPAMNSIGSLRVGRYTNLPGGSYDLRLIGSNQDGVWNENGLVIKVIVIPPFWQTTWFVVTALFGFLGLVFAGYRVRVNSIKTTNRELERQVQDRTQQIARLFEKAKELAVIEERNRLARELHDSAKQKAFAALAQLGTARGVIASDPRAAKNHLDEAENLVYEVIEELTFLIQEMYPLSLKEKGLATSLREYLFEWENRTGIKVEMHIEGEKRLKLEIEQAVYRIIQESLSNVARHSRAKQVNVTLSFRSGSVEASVADDGCGFDVENRPCGVGLRSIHERVESLGGTLEVVSTTGRGTRLTARIPVRSARKSRIGAGDGKS